MDPPQQKCRGLTESIIGLMIFCGFCVVLSALPCALVVGFSVQEGWLLRIEVIAAVTAIIAATGGAILGLGILLNKQWLRRQK